MSESESPKDQHPEPPADRGALPPHQRRERIQMLVDERGFVRVSELREAFGVSGVTARSDLDALEAAGVLQRVHGGAVPAPTTGAGARPDRESSFEEALAASVLPKQQIGVLAASLVSSGQSLILDVGTTTLAVARALLARTELTDVVIITNGLSIALELEPAIPRFTVIVTGGSLRPLQHSLVEPLAATVLGQVHADLAFIGCNGVDAERGVTNINLPEAGVKTLMLAAATRAIVVADGSKLGQVHLGRIGALTAFDTLVTDADASADLLAPLRDAGLTVLQPGLG
ncbi:DeoR family transcriptional regulator of aga operon [Cryobacterium sp. MP_M5]|uniref:DeoR/GlpR family DNA-binding transcription regulator n=1 Tax=unclassified Cryobacterium TaxID=2649013 RepID=UPI0018CBC35C|nr:MULTISPECIES: DeoR/GlpR family DNA-binding transcription regulator [unclassified Cryobacterium]MBG6057139.1 DeoR family transcriptional regulator of aga operon [Cryobacterium sp. MP_M3]MEC5175338.1 DeoR family transcriptional regulator of aga operon [Cryobacterium sp. MP_M5]